MADETKPSSRGRSRGKVVVGLLVVLAGVIAVGALVYVRYLRYERVAALHLPPETTAAARVDLEQVVLFEPVRKHLLPLANEGAQGGSRLERLEERTGIVFGRSIREVVVGRGATWADWFVIIGGRFGGDSLVPPLAEVLAEEGRRWTLSGRVLAAPGGGVTIGQASDGVVVIGSSERLVRAALPQQDTHQKLGLDPSRSAAALAVSGDFVRGYALSPAAFVTPGLRDLGNCRRITGQLKLGDPVTASIDVELEPGADADAMKRGVDVLLASLKGFSRVLPGPDFAGERTALDAATVSRAEETGVRVTFPWNRADMDRGARSLAKAVRAWRGEPK